MIDRRDDGRTYYGVPDEVRDTLSLEQQEKPAIAETSIETGRGEREAFSGSLIAFSKKVGASENQEWLEYAAELLQSARKEGVIEFEDIPEAFRAVDIDIDLVCRVPDALMTLLEATYGSELFDDAEKLAEKAVEAGIVEESALSEALAEIHEYNS